MSYVEIETGRYVKRWAFWNPATWSIPKLYWDAWSQEQRIHAICRQLEKVIKYADYLGVNVDDIAARLKAIEEGQLNDIIVATIERWFEENEPEIVEAIEQLQSDVSDIVAEIGTGFDSENTVTDAIEGINNEIEGINNEIGTGFDSENTIASNVTRLSLIASVKPYYGYNMVSIGDSFMAGTGATEEAYRIPNRIAHRLGMTLFNYAVGGAGFWDEHGENASFPHQIEKALGEMTADEIANTKLVVIYGGYNDYAEYLDGNVSRGVWLNKITDTMSAARNGFPNANVFVVPMNWKCYEFDNVARVWYYEAVELVKKTYMRNMFVIEGAPFWNLGLLSNYSGGANIHPNDNGYLETAARMMKVIEGNGDVGISRSQSIPYSEVTFGNRIIEDVNGIVHLPLYNFTASGLTADAVVLTLPDRYIPQFDFAVPFLWNFACGGVLRIRNTGVVTLNKNSSLSYPLSGTGYITPITYPLYARKVQGDN